jgi:glutathione synthase/RimK-type ligase-like ATP-grasp enzyme
VSSDPSQDAAAQTKPEADAPLRVALATCKDARGLAPDDRGLVAALEERGVQVDVQVWDDASVDWSRYDLTVVRSTWDFARRRAEFVKWAQAVPRIENQAKVLEWNTDRRYFKALAERGVPVIDTIWLDPESHLSSRAIHARMPAFGDFVVKPVVFAGSEDIARYQPISAQSRAKAIAHTQRLLAKGDAVMIQPYVESIDTLGEACLTFVNDEFQHAVRRKALLGGTHRATVGLSLYAGEGMTSVAVTEQQLAVAQQALAVAHELSGSAEPFLYARVDLVQGTGNQTVGATPNTHPTDGPLVIEIELTEPSLWLKHSGSAPTLARFADAIVARARRYRSGEAASS